MSTEKAMEWTFKIATALVIPTIVWTFKISNEIAILKERSAIISESKSTEILHKTATQAAVNSETIKGVKETVDRISKTLDRIENHVLSGKP